MQAEIDSIHSNNTWTLVELPPHKKAISSKWVYKVKTSTNGAPPRYKARLVARGFEQKNGTDFLDIFALVVRWETIRTLIAIAIHLNWPIHQLDVLTAFLNDILEEDVYMLRRGTENLVCKLHKSLYGLKQSPCAWYARLHTALLAWSLTQSYSDPNLYFAHIGNHTIALLVYVDDILITGNNLQLITKLKTHLQHTSKPMTLARFTNTLGFNLTVIPQDFECIKLTTLSVSFSFSIWSTATHLTLLFQRVWYSLRTPIPHLSIPPSIECLLVSCCFLQKPDLTSLTL